MKKALLIDDECWLRVQARDASADGRFVFAVRTTGVFCRPSCRSKRALRKNVRFFANAQQALDAGFRPCKRCQPDNARAQQRRLDKIACACRQQLAATIGKPTAVRAVASACGANKLAMVIPCHRVVRRDGALSGYRWGVRRKAQLLKREAQKEE